MTDHTNLLEQSFELNLNNYGPEDVERLNDWAINAYAALEALQAEVVRLTTLARGQHIELYNARLQLAAAQGQSPIDAVPLDDMVEGSHPSYGRGLFATDNCVKQFYAAPIPRPPSPSEAAITYMTGYSDGIAWAAAQQPKETK